MENLEEAMKRAAEIAQLVPENLQEAAFNRALDRLLEDDGAQEREPKKTTVRKPTSKNQATKTDDAGLGLLEQINRTQYPDVGVTERVADRALKVLFLALHDFSIDGLTSSQITDVLSKKLRLPVKKSAVHMALTREKKTVDMREDGQGQTTFHIMEPGEKYLKRLANGEISATKPAKSGMKKSRAKKKDVGSDNPHQSRKAAPTGKPAKAGSKASSATGKRKVGVMAAMSQIFDKGFFAQERTISAIVQKMKLDQGRTFKSNEVSPVLLRWLRTDKVERKKNEDGQYEYKQL